MQINLTLAKQLGNNTLLIDLAVADCTDFASCSKLQGSQPATATYLETHYSIHPTSLRQSKMPCTAARHPLQKLVTESCSFRQIPSFLVPSLANARCQRSFSTTRTSQSRVGGATISVPPEVSLRFYDLPKSNVRSRKTDLPTSAVDVVGPLGRCRGNACTATSWLMLHRANDITVASIPCHKPQ